MPQASFSPAPQPRQLRMPHRLLQQQTAAISALPPGRRGDGSATRARRSAVAEAMPRTDHQRQRLQIRTQVLTLCTRSSGKMRPWVLFRRSQQHVVVGSTAVGRPT